MFFAAMKDAFDRYYNPSFHRHIEPELDNEEDWHLVQRVEFETDSAMRFVELARSKAAVQTHDAIRQAFDRQMSIEETARHFVRDAANARKESPELREVRDDFRREFLALLGSDLERMGLGAGPQGVMARDAIAEVEDAVRGDPSLPLRAAFSLKLAAAKRDAHEGRQRRGADETEAPPASLAKKAPSQEHARPQESIAREYGALGERRLQNKEYDEADRCFAAASAIYEALGQQGNSALMLERRGHSLVLDGKRDAAREQWNRALARYGNVRDYDAARRLRQSMATLG
jgi:hypothetical protein